MEQRRVVIYIIVAGALKLEEHFDLPTDTDEHQKEDQSG